MRSSARRGGRSDADHAARRRAGDRRRWVGPASKAFRFLAAQQIGEAGLLLRRRLLRGRRLPSLPEVADQNQAETPIVRASSSRSGFRPLLLAEPRRSRRHRTSTAISRYFAPWEWYIVATDYASGFLDRLPPQTLQSLLNGYRQESVRAAFVARPVGAPRLVCGVERVANVRGERARRPILTYRSSARKRVQGGTSSRLPAAGFRRRGRDRCSAWNASTMLTSRYVYIVVFSLVVAVVVIWVSSRIAGRFIARPIRSLSERLTRRLGGAHTDPQYRQPDDLRELVLQQLRALVRLDYETKGRHARPSVKQWWPSRSSDTRPRESSSRTRRG